MKPSERIAAIEAEIVKPFGEAEFYTSPVSMSNTRWLLARLKRAEELLDDVFKQRIDLEAVAQFVRGAEDESNG